MGERSRGWLLACSLALSAWSCAGTEPPSHNGESHWLDACLYDGDCGGGNLRCVCGTCTRGCEGDHGCGERGEAMCVDAESPLLLRRCDSQGLAANDAVCIARCESDRDCPSGTGCASGACVPLPSLPDAGPPAPTPDAAVPVDPSDATVQPPDAGDPIRDRIDALAPIDASVSFDEAVDVPEPETSIAGGDERLIGTWRQLECEPSSNWCVRFEIGRDSGGAVVGTLSTETTASPPKWDAVVPIDPEQGYPPGQAVMNYEALRMIQTPGASYRILDGRWDGKRLRFAWSGSDVWREWCALQTPHPWTFGERTFHQCVPQDPEALASIDPNKQYLCRYQNLALRDPACRMSGEQCFCDPSSQDCVAPVCLCDADGCQVDVRIFQQPVDLVLEGEQLVGEFRKGGDYAFERMSP